MLAVLAGTAIVHISLPEAKLLEAVTPEVRTLSPGGGGGGGGVPPLETTRLPQVTVVYLFFK
jgi:hypothetical protein